MPRVQRNPHSSVLGCSLGAEHPAPDVADIRLNISSQEAGSGSVLPAGQLRAVNIPVREIISSPTTFVMRPWPERQAGWTQTATISLRKVPQSAWAPLFPLIR
jgi:hypothetical protein